MRADAHISVIPLLVKAYHSVIGKVAYVLLLIFLAVIVHKLYCLVPGENKRLNRNIFLYDFFHFSLDFLQILLGKLCVAQINIIVKAFFVCRAVCKIRMRIKTLYRLRHNVRGGMAHNVKLLLRRTYVHSAVIINYLHLTNLLHKKINTLGK